MKTFLAAVLATVLLVQGLGAAGPGGPADRARKDERAVEPAVGPAEQHLSGLAGKMEHRRKLSGPLLALLSVGMIGGGIAMLDEEEDMLGLNRAMGTFGVGAGIVGLGASVYALAFKSPAENAETKVLAIADDAARERAAADELARLARNERTSRKISGYTALALAAASLAFVDDEDSSARFASAGLISGTALLYFLIKGPAEKAYRSYKEGLGPNRPAPDLVVGFTPRGGVVAGFSWTF